MTPANSLHESKPMGILVALGWFDALIGSFLPLVLQSALDFPLPFPVKFSLFLSSLSLAVSK